MFGDNSKYYALMLYPFGESANLYIAAGNVHSVNRIRFWEESCWKY